MHIILIDDGPDGTVQVLIGERGRDPRDGTTPADLLCGEVRELLAARVAPREANTEDGSEG